MRGSSYIAALAASALAAAFVTAPHPALAKTQASNAPAAVRALAAHRLAKSAPAPTLAQMDLKPRGYVVRSYAPAYRGGDGRTPMAVDYRFAGDGVASFGLHRGSGGLADPAGVNPSFASAPPAAHASVGALVTYSLP